MKRMVIFEPAMCCQTGVCGPSVNKELLRMSIVLKNLKSRGVLVERYNLNSNPQIFIDNKTINEMLNKDGVEVLPVTMVDGVVVKTRVYPTNGELCSLLDVPPEYLRGTAKESSGGCGCKNGCC